VTDIDTTAISLARSLVFCTPAVLSHDNATRSTAINGLFDVAFETAPLVSGNGNGSSLR